MRTLVLALLLANSAGFAQKFETGDRVNPGAKLSPLATYTIAGRPQRVRFFLSNRLHVESYLGNAEAKDMWKADPIATGEGSWFGSLTGYASGVVRSFADDLDNNGLAINPALVTCASDLLAMVKTAAEANRSAFNTALIDEVNLFLKPVDVAQASHYKLERSPVAQRPNDPALNVQIPFVVATSQCALPDPTALNAALTRLLSGNAAANEAPTDFDLTDSVKTKSHQQQPYTVGGRPQRVRFFESRWTEGTTYDDSPQITSMKADPAKAGAEAKYLNWAQIAQSPSSLGLTEFSEKSSHSGLVVNPHYIQCGADLLKLVKQVGDTNSDAFAKKNIDEINLFLKPVVVPAGNHYKVAITPVADRPADPALNIQIPIVFTKEGTRCPLPTVESLDRLFKRMAQ